MAADRPLLVLRCSRCGDSIYTIVYGESISTEELYEYYEYMGQHSCSEKGVIMKVMRVTVLTRNTTDDGITEARVFFVRAEHESDAVSKVLSESPEFTEFGAIHVDNLEGAVIIAD